MIKIVPFKAEHFERLQIRESMAASHQALLTKVAGEHFPPDCAFTLFDDYEVLGIVGYFPLTTWRVEAWSLISENITREAVFSGGRMVRRGIQSIYDAGYHRIEAIVDPNDNEAIRMVEFLEFVKEGRLRQFMHDKRDMLLYSKVKNGQ